MSTILDLIGNTPLMQIGNVYFKMEMLNPSGSIKDRIAKEMIGAIVDSEFLVKDRLQIAMRPSNESPIFIEATSGNTGISVAMVAAALGCRSVIYAAGISKMQYKLMKSYGAEVYRVATMRTAMTMAKTYSLMIKDTFYLDQFNNSNNVLAQQKMAEEALQKLDSWTPTGVYHTDLLPDAIVAGVGTGGTLMGLHNVFPNAEIYAIAPLGRDKIEGLQDGVVTPLIPENLEYVTLYVSRRKAKKTAKMLRLKHGIFCGLSSGANYYASTQLINFKKILTVFPDAGYRYLCSKE